MGTEVFMLGYLVQGLGVVLGQHVVWSWSKGEVGVSPGQHDPGGGHAHVWCYYSLYVTTPSFEAEMKAWRD